MEKMKKSKEIIKSNTFQYFDDDFYGFLHSTSRGRSNKKIRFKSRETKIFTPRDAFLVKSFIDNNDMRYRNLNISSILSNSSVIQRIINQSEKSNIINNSEKKR